MESDERGLSGAAVPGVAISGVEEEKDGSVEKAEAGTRASDGNASESEESDYGVEGFGYKNIVRAQVPIPKNYLMLQMAFADAFPWHDASLVCERANGKSIGPGETDFKKDELIVFREYMPEIRKDKQLKKVQGLNSAWEEVEYGPGLGKFKLRSWQNY
jgi:hypothetical protein